MLANDLIHFKGTRHGLLVSCSENGAFEEIMDEFKEKLETNSSFFKNAPISLDLGWRELNQEEFSTLHRFFEDNNIKLQGIISCSAYTRGIAESYGIKVIIGRLGLAQHEGRVRKQREKFKPHVENPAHEKEKSILIKRTLRSGQKVKYQGNIVILGDINPGAEVEAGGDIVVWGSIRGIVHAGANGMEDASIIASQIAPTQMRIGTGFGLISYDKKLDQDSLKIAQLKGAEIIVSNYKR